MKYQLKLDLGLAKSLQFHKTDVLVSEARRDVSQLFNGPEAQARGF
jgi:hypothetical protein